MCSLPRFANPHIQDHQTVTISRSQLWPDEHEENLGAGLLGKRARIKLDNLNHLVEEEFRLQSCLPTDFTQPTTTVLEDDRQQTLGGKHIFRLLKGHPKYISLDPPPQIEGRCLERPSEDTEAEYVVRRQLAREATVEIMKHLGSDLHESLQSTRSNRHFLAASSPSLPTLAVIERDRTSQIDTTMPPPTAILKISSCPTVVVIEACGRDLAPARKGQKRARRRRKPTAPLRPLPSFYRPLTSGGDKPHGYAYGYPSSRPGLARGRQPSMYVRDSMKRAVFRAVP